MATIRAELEYDRKTVEARAVGGQWSGAQIGKIVYGAVHDPEGRWVHILGRRWILPQSDSALVILVDRVDTVGGPPTIVAARYIASSLPSNLFRHDTTSRDASLAVRELASMQSALLELLSRTSTIRDFWQ